MREQAFGDPVEIERFFASSPSDLMVN